MVRRITDAQRAECIRLRLKDQLSAPEIAKRVGISNQSAYKALARHPWHGSRKHHRAWTAEEIRLIHELWPIADEPDLLRALPKRNMSQIGRKACSLGIRRRLPGARKNPRTIHPIVAALRAERERRRMTRADLAKRSGHHANNLQMWENGKAHPLFRALFDWAQSLGFELILQPIGAEPAPIVPSRAQMMGRR